MAKDHDANPLHSREESRFTSDLLDFFEAQAAAQSRALKTSVTENLSGMKEIKVLDTTIRLEELEPIRNKMQQELEQGNRFVSYLSGSSPVNKDDFTACTSLFNAHEHAYENTTDRDVFVIRSTSVVLAQMNQLLHHPTFKQAIMDASVSSFNENQFKRVGMGEAFTPELVQKMQEKQPVIQHSFKKEYEGDKVDAVLHLRKSATSDHYFLNKFDLTLQKEGAANSVKQTFYIGSRKQTEGQDTTHQTTKVDQKYTLKEAYNLLAGRPVDKLQVNKAGEQYQAWEKMNLHKVLANGNHEIKRYTQHYGFDLSQTMSNYSIKELRNDAYKDSLETSLRRGNLQKATFTDKEGKEEKLYVSPNITLGTLHVYDQHKKPLSVDVQLEKGYIKPGFAEALKERIQHINQQHKQEEGKSTVHSENGARTVTEKLPDEKLGNAQTAGKPQKAKKEAGDQVQKVKKPAQRPKR